MTVHLRVMTVLVVLTVLAGACTSSSDPSVEDPSAAPPPAGTEGAAAETAETAGETAGGLALAPGAQIDADTELLELTADWIREESGLSEMLQEEIFLQQVTRSRDVNHLRFVQQHDRISVRGAQFIVHVRDSGEVLGASRSLTETLPGEGVSEELSQQQAADIALQAVPGTVDGDPDVRATWLEDGAELRLGWEVRVPTTDPPSNYGVVVDATTGDVLSVDRLATDGHGAPTTGPRKAAGTDDAVEVAQSAACDAPEPPSACIFVVDPIYAAGGDIDPARANGTLVGVRLPNLLDPTSGDLVGRYAEIAPEVAADYAQPDGVWGEAGRGGEDVSFEAGMTYYWIDYSQQVVQEMGFDFHASDPVAFVPIEPGFPDNAFYLFVEDRIHMGASGDGVNEAEDAQGIIHEYGHALLQAAVPDIITEEGGAFHESVGDLVSVFTTLEFRNGDVACLFHWAERGECLRRVDADLVYPEDLRFEVHLDGELYNGAVWDVFTTVLQEETGLSPEECQDRQRNPCDAVRDQVYATLLGSLPFLTPTMTLDDAATAFAVSDQTFFAGANAATIQQVFGERGLAATGTPSVQIQGLMDFERSRSVAAVKIDHSYRGDLQLTLDVLGAGDETLCSAVLIQPDPSDDGDGITGRFDLAGTECATHLPPGPEQRWRLTVVDTAAEDDGTLFQFSLSHEGQRFLAPGLPAPIPDAESDGVAGTITG